MKRNIFFVLLSFVIFLLAVSCSKKDSETIVFDNSEPLALAPDIEWAVVTEPYSAFKATAHWQAEVTGHCRKGDILKINGKSIDSSGEKWFYFKDGWLSESCLSVYNNRLKAKNISEKLLEKE